MIYAQPGSSFSANVAGFPAGLTGTVGVQILNASGGVTTARTTVGISESPASSGSYIVTLTAPATSGAYRVFWDTGVISPSTTATEELTVSSTTPPGVSSATYVTLAALKTTLNITNTAADEDLTGSISAASRAIDLLCQRRFWPDADTAQVRYYSPRSPWHLDVDDIAVLTSLASTDDGTTTFGQTWTLNADFVLEPLDAQTAVEQWPYTRLRVHPSGTYRFNTWFPRSVKVTAQFGWPAVPAAIVEATTHLAERLFKMKREAPLGVLAFEQLAVTVGRVDRNLMLLLGPYMLRRGTVG